MALLRILVASLTTASAVGGDGGRTPRFCSSLAASRSPASLRPAAAAGAPGGGATRQGRELQQRPLQREDGQGAGEGEGAVRRLRVSTLQGTQLQCGLRVFCCVNIRKLIACIKSLIECQIHHLQSQVENVVYCFCFCSNGYRRSRDCRCRMMNLLRGN